MKKLLLATLCFLFIGIVNAQQTAEWRLMQGFYSGVDPDGAGPAVGSVAFVLEMRAVNGAPFTASDIAVGFSWQSTKAMIPTTSACTGNPPSNITVSSQFTSATFTYTSVNQCNATAVTTGGQLFDRTAVGSLLPSSGGINLTTAWTPALTITLWALSPLAPQAGYVMVHSGDGGSPGPLSSYSMATTSGTGEATVNSQTYTTPLALGSTTMPVVLNSFNTSCSEMGTRLNWTAQTQNNNDRFEIEKSTNGANWSTIGRLKSADGNSVATKNYQYIDAAGGNALYRLKQVDKDGSFTYTNIKSANCGIKQPQLYVYPVPAKNILNIVLPSEINGNVTIQLVDVLGRVLQQSVQSIQAGSNNIQLNVATLITGEYMLRIVEANNVRTQKIMINN